MQFSYFQTDTGSTIVTCGQFPRRSRKSFPGVNLQKLNSLAQALNLTEIGKVKLLLKLQHIKNVFDIGNATDSVSADTAVARWIGEIEKSIQRIKVVYSDGEPKFVEALDAMATIGDEWVKSKIAIDKNDIDVSNLGFDIQYVQGFTSYGSHQFIKQWFSQAQLIAEFAKGAKKRLIDLNRAQNRLSGRISKEALLYGHQLPRLYTQITKCKFGVTKQGDAVKKTTGVAFVIDCSEAIGLQSISPAGVASHWHNLNKTTG